MFAQDKTRFDYFYDMLMAAVPAYEGTSGFPLKAAAALWRILIWKVQYGNAFSIASVQDPLDQMVNDYLGFIYLSHPKPQWLALLEGNNK